MIVELKRKLKDEESIIFSSQEGYYYRFNGEFDKGVEVLEKAYENMGRLLRITMNQKYIFWQEYCKLLRSSRFDKYS